MNRSLLLVALVCIAGNTNKLDALFLNFTPRWLSRQKFVVDAGAAP